MFVGLAETAMSPFGGTRTSGTLLIQQQIFGLSEAIVQELHLFLNK
jgi:hypothetical protein